MLVNAEESEAVTRTVRSWLNTYPNKPVKKLEFEFLGVDGGLCMSTIQSAYKTRQFIDGSYQAQYQFKLIYRTTAKNANERIRADEVLNNMAAWAETHTKPEIADNIRITRVQRDMTSALFARYDGDVEDHQILMTIFYEVS